MLWKLRKLKKEGKEKAGEAQQAPNPSPKKRKRFDSIANGGVPADSESLRSDPRTILGYKYLAALSSSSPASPSTVQVLDSESDPGDMGRPTLFTEVPKQSTSSSSSSSNAISTLIKNDKQRPRSTSQDTMHKNDHAYLDKDGPATSTSTRLDAHCLNFISLSSKRQCTGKLDDAILRDYHVKELAKRAPASRLTRLRANLSTSTPLEPPLAERVRSRSR